jgi:hypothetical protein
MKIDYDLLEDTQNEALLFLLQECENELPLRRVRILLHARSLCSEEALGSELYDVACDLEDVEQEVQRLIGFLREKQAMEITENMAYEFFLARVETCPTETKLKLLDAAQHFENLPGATDFEKRYMQCYQRVNQWVQKYELLKFHIRTRHHEMRNAEAGPAIVTAIEAERAAKTAAA